MLTYRAILSVATIVVGAIIFVEVLGLGLRFQSVPGLVLGCAMIALGLHRLRLIWFVVRKQSQ